VEIEAKFAADAAALRRLAAADVLAGYTLGRPTRAELHDTYMDTDDEALLRAGYACRLRAGDKGIAIQVKGLSGGGGAVHRREELEVILQKEGAPRDWPAGAARDLNKYASKTNRGLIIGGLALLFVVGLGLITLFYGPQAALVGFLCLLGGLVPIGLVALAMVGLNAVVKKIKKE